MSMRLYPDIIVASEVKDSLDDIVLISKKNNEDGENNYFKYIFKVYISAEQCTKHQKAYTKRGLGNVFLGYEGRDWTKEDYKAYFDSNPSVFTRLEDDVDHIQEIYDIALKYAPDYDPEKIYIGLSQKKELIEN